MKTIGYLIQAYSDYNAFKNLCDTLLDMGNCEIFVHLDSKSDYKKFYIDNEKIHFIEKREFVSWAGYQQGKLILNLINYATNYNTVFDRYVFLSESDYPVYSGDQLFEKIVATKTTMINCSELQPQKIEKYWFYDFSVKSVFWNKVINKILNSVLEVFYKLHIARKKNKVLIDGNYVDVYCSGPFWQYDYEQIKYIDACFNRNASIEKYFKHSFASCELMVSTIIANSIYGKECVYRKQYKNLEDLSSLCYFKYNGPRVNALTELDYQDIIDSNKPFIRKVNNSSQKLIDLIKQDWK